MNSELTLDPDGEEFLLRKTFSDQTSQTMRLSEADVLKLAQSAQRLEAHILSKKSRPEAGVQMSNVTPVAQIRLNNDLHSAEILLGLIDGQGAEITFSLAPEVAQSLADRLPVRLSQIAQAKKTVQ
jgi:hypothetical protein